MFLEYSTTTTQPHSYTTLQTYRLYDDFELFAVIKSWYYTRGNGAQPTCCINIYPLREGKKWFKITFQKVTEYIPGCSLTVSILSIKQLTDSQNIIKRLKSKIRVFLIGLSTENIHMEQLTLLKLDTVDVPIQLRTVIEIILYCN